MGHELVGSPPVALANARRRERPGRSSRRRLASVCAVALAAFFTVGCSAASIPEVANGDPVLEQGRDIYARACASCHGSAGGGGRGPQLSDGMVLDAYPEIEDNLALVREGRGAMPGFGGRLTDEEIEAVVRYSREVLAVTAAEG